MLFFVFCPLHCIVELIFSATLAFSVFIFVSCFQGNYTCIEWCFSEFYAFLCCLCTLLSLFLKEQRIEKFSYCVMSVNIAFPFDITTSGILIFILALIFIYKKNLTIWSHYKWFHINCTQFWCFKLINVQVKGTKVKLLLDIYIIKTYDYNVKYENWSLLHSLVVSHKLYFCLELLWIAFALSLYFKVMYLRGLDGCGHFLGYK